MTISSDAASRRESARQTTGEFGHQGRTEPGDLALAPDPNEFVPVLSSDEDLFRAAAIRADQMRESQPMWVDELGAWLDDSKDQMQMRRCDLLEAQQQAIAILNTPDHGVVSPGLTYRPKAKDAVYVLSGTGEPLTAAQASERLFEGVSVIAGNDQFIVPERAGDRREGDRYEGRYRQPAAIAKDIRGDLQAAVAVGWLPDLRYRVTSRDGSVNIQVDGVTDEQRKDPYKSDEFNERRRTDRDGIRDLERRVEAIRVRYGYDRSDSMTDYFDTAYYGTTRVLTDRERAWREEEIADARARRKARASVGSS